MKQARNYDEDYITKAAITQARQLIALLLPLGKSDRD